MKMSANTERKIRDVRDVWGYGGGGGVVVDELDPTPKITVDGNGGNAETRIRHKYKTLERHLSMKKTIRKKMMRDLREIGDAAPQPTAAAAAADDADRRGAPPPVAFLEQLRTDQPPSANVDKPSLWKRLTKGWGHA